MPRENARSPFRLSVTVPIAVSVAGYAAPVPAIIVNLSENGCRVTARSILLTGSAIQFELQRPGAPALKLQGTVRNTEPGKAAGEGNQYGIEFRPLSKGDASALHAIIAQAQEHHANVMRVEADFPVQCKLAGQRETLAAAALDISRGGMRIAIDRLLPDDCNLALRFTLPSGPGRPVRELQVEARLLRGSQRPRGEYHYSVLFVNPSAAVVDEIDRFVHLADAQ